MVNVTVSLNVIAAAHVNEQMILNVQMLSTRLNYMSLSPRCIFLFHSRGKSISTLLYRQVKRPKGGVRYWVHVPYFFIFLTSIVARFLVISLSTKTIFF